MSGKKPNFLTGISEKIDADLGGADYSRYQGDLLGFGESVLGQAYPSKIKEVMRSVSENRVTIVRSCNGPGKSYCTGAIGAGWLLSYPQSKVVLSANPYRQLQNVLWPKICSIYSQFPELFANYNLKSDEGLFDKNDPEHCLLKLTIPSQGTIEERKGKISGYHAPHALYIFDEADAIPEWVYSTVETCMSGEHERLLCLFNPRRSSGRMYQLERTGGANVIHISAFDHENVISGENLFPGAVTRSTTITRINEYTRPLAQGEQRTRNCFEVPGFLVGETTERPNQRGTYYPPLPEGIRYIEDSDFSHMVLGEYPAQASNQLISAEWIDAARKRWDEYVSEYGQTPPREYGVAGLDMAEMGGDQCVFFVRYPNGFVEIPKMWSMVKIDESAVRATDLCSTRRIRSCNIDDTGVGNGTDRIMIRLGCNCNVFGVKFGEKPIEGLYQNRFDQREFKHLKDQLYWMLREWLQSDPNAMIPPDEMLIEELLAVFYEPEELTGKIIVTKKKVMKELLGRSPDRLESLVLTFYEPEEEEWDFS